MGQYHAIYNLDKKQMLSPHALDDGAKLLEFNNINIALNLLLSNSNGRGGGDIGNYGDTETTLSGMWAGDRIVIQGDYAEPGDLSFVDHGYAADFENISDRVFKYLYENEFITPSNYFVKSRGIKK